ncbi:hypothetical protein QAD02_006523 [Eretmocerus hayati]|uniref:Uncharacterized protein n=1 Tax=Eretmocerus hayati TaxID=131215 RepID=A0ACC2N1Y0_9HYME|nr:hypothetical protein QAD02_006523 [Eretmocerus hayati]
MGVSDSAACIIYKKSIIVSRKVKNLEPGVEVKFHWPENSATAKISNGTILAFSENEKDLSDMMLKRYKNKKLEKEVKKNEEETLKYGHITAKNLSDEKIPDGEYKKELDDKHTSYGQLDDHQEPDDHDSVIDSINDIERQLIADLDDLKEHIEKRFKILRTSIAIRIKEFQNSPTSSKVTASFQDSDINENRSKSSGMDEEDSESDEGFEIYNNRPKITIAKRKGYYRVIGNSKEIDENQLMAGDFSHDFPGKKEELGMYRKTTIARRKVYYRIIGNPKEDEQNQRMNYFEFKDEDVVPSTSCSTSANDEQTDMENSSDPTNVISFESMIPEHFIRKSKPILTSSDGNASAVSEKSVDTLKNSKDPKRSSLVETPRVAAKARSNRDMSEKCSSEVDFKMAQEKESKRKNTVENDNVKKEDKRAKLQDKSNQERSKQIDETDSEDERSEWTLRFPKKNSKDLTELKEKSRVFLRITDYEKSIDNAHRSTELARSLFRSVFTKEALKNCSLTGSQAKGNGKKLGCKPRPGLNQRAVNTIISFCKNYGKSQKNWPSQNISEIKASLQAFLQERKIADRSKEKYTKTKFNNDED